MAEESMPPDRNAPKRHVGDEPAPDRIAKQGFKRVAGFGVAEIERACLAPLGRLLDTPERDILDLTIGSDGGDMTGLELVDAAIDRMGRRHVSEPHIGGERIAVELRLPGGQHLERFQLGGEDDAAVLPSPVKRLDAEPVADEA